MVASSAKSGDAKATAYSEYFQGLYKELYEREDARANQQISRQPFTVGTSTFLLAGVGYLWREMAASNVETFGGHLAMWCCFAASVVAAGILVIAIVHVIMGLWPRRLSPPLTPRHIYDHSKKYRDEYLSDIPETPKQEDNRLEEEIRNWTAEQYRIAATDLADRNNARSRHFSKATIWLAIASLALLFGLCCLHAVYKLRKLPTSVNVIIPSMNSIIASPGQPL